MEARETGTDVVGTLARTGSGSAVVGAMTRTVAAVMADVVGTLARTGSGSAVVGAMTRTVAAVMAAIAALAMVVLGADPEVGRAAALLSLAATVVEARATLATAAAVGDRTVIWPFTLLPQHFASELSNRMPQAYGTLLPIFERTVRLVRRWSDLCRRTHPPRRPSTLRASCLPGWHR